MGILKKLLQMFSCKSDCTFNTSDFNQDLRRIDLSKYELKVSDLIRLEKIVKKRPSIYTYTHDKQVGLDITDV